MTITPTNAPTQTAKPKGMSLYEKQWEYLKRKAQELTQQTGRYVSASQVTQMLIDQAMKRDVQK